LNHISDNKILTTNSDKSFLSIFIQYIKQIPNIENFISIGDITIEHDNSEINFEIQCRYFNSGHEGELEILFNDVTRTKSIENQNAEFKYKTLFLNKIAHEFKNPLICINELINQFYDQSTDSDEEIKIKKILDQIKSLSNFLLILVKDLNYFSESQMGKDINLDMKETDLYEVISFSKNITTSLLKKSNKNDSIDFMVKIKKDVPKKIFTDEWRIKQVIINLLSNAVKFTLYGHIVFDVSLEILNDQTFIKFLVEDTGVGIRKEHFNTLFKPFSKNIKKNNELGSGLGLSIASEICGKISNGLDFESTPGKGTRFWFYILLNNFNRHTNNYLKEIPKRRKSKFSSKNLLNLGSINESFETKDMNHVPLIKNLELEEYLNNVNNNNDSEIDSEINSNEDFSYKIIEKPISTLMLNKNQSENLINVKIF
jgi:signal transduction histidine kinase